MHAGRRGWYGTFMHKHNHNKQWWMRHARKLPARQGSSRPRQLACRALLAACLRASDRVSGAPEASVRPWAAVSAVSACAPSIYMRRPFLARTLAWH